MRLCGIYGGTYSIGVLDLTLDVHLVTADNRNDSFTLKHGGVFLLIEPLVITLHHTVEARAEKVHVLRVHDMVEGILILGPEDTPLNH